MLVICIKEYDTFEHNETIPEVLDSKDLNEEILQVMESIGAIDILKQIC